MRFVEVRSHKGTILPNRLPVDSLKPSGSLLHTGKLHPSNCWFARLGL